MRWGKRVIASQGTTLTPLPSGGPTDDQHLLFPSGESTRRLREAEAGVKGMKWGAKKGAGGTLMVDPKSKLGKAHTAVSREMADVIQGKMNMGRSKRQVAKLLRDPNVRKSFADMGEKEYGLDRKTATKMANSLADQHLKVL